MTLYLSDYKKYPKIIEDNQLSGLTTLDSFATNLYRTVKYALTVEDGFTNSIYQCRFTVTHNSLVATITEFDVINDDILDVEINADYANVVNGFPTTVDVTTTFPINFNGSWSLEKEVFVNISQIQKSGADGPNGSMTPSDYLYPS